MPPTTLNSEEPGISVEVPPLAYLPGTERANLKCKAMHRKR